MDLICGIGRCTRAASSSQNGDMGLWESLQRVISVYLNKLPQADAITLQNVAMDFFSVRDKEYGLGRCCHR